MPWKASSVMEERLRLLRRLVADDVGQHVSNRRDQLDHFLSHLKIFRLRNSG